MSAHSPAASQGDARSIRKIVLAGSLGTLIEYYDWALYGYVAAIIAPLFFPGGDPTAALLSTLAVFALSYVIRPIGGIFFGAFGDKFGRRPALLVTVVGIGLANTAIGFLPTYASVGVLAPILLLIVRIAQGFFAGGEVGGAATVITEAAPPGKKGWYASFVPVGTNGGFAIASAAVGLVSGLVTTSAMNEWAWRIPFWAGLPLTIVCFLARRFLPRIDNDESPRHGFPLISAFRSYPGPLIKGILLGIGVQGTAYVGATFLSIYLITSLHYAKTPVYWITAGGTLFGVLMTPLAGRLVDRIGSVNVTIIGLATYAIVTYPALVIMDFNNLFLAGVGYFVVAVNMATAQAGNYTLTPQLFGPEVRYTGTALVTNVSVVIAGGTAPYICTWLVSSTGNLRSPYFFVLGVSLIGIATLLTMRRLNVAQGSRLGGEHADPGGQAHSPQFLSSDLPEAAGGR
ncbi:MFS transporter [Amycolatopsis sp. NPDC049253]|uniref:MFS transporter n=1 Tax=Amycolatopsis sp. NPDC049253 TaxID=3155274 RepID=UPI00341417B0